MNVNGAGIVMGRQILIRFCRLVLPVTIVISLCLTWNCLDRNLMVCLPKSCFARLLGKFMVLPTMPTIFHSWNSGWVFQLEYNLAFF